MPQHQLNFHQPQSLQVLLHYKTSFSYETLRTCKNRLYINTPYSWQSGFKISISFLCFFTGLQEPIKERATRICIAIEFYFHGFPLKTRFPDAVSFEENVHFIVMFFLRKNSLPLSVHQDLIFTEKKREKK